MRAYWSKKMYIDKWAKDYINIELFDAGFVGGGGHGVWIYELLKTIMSFCGLSKCHIYTLQVEFRRKFELGYERSLIKMDGLRYHYLLLGFVMIHWAGDPDVAIMP